MNRSRIIKILLFTFLLVVVAIWCSHAIGLSKRGHMRSNVTAQPAGAPQQLSDAGQASLRAIVQAGSLSELRWPDFGDYSKILQEFYGSYGYSLAWISKMQPTTQAR